MHFGSQKTLPFFLCKNVQKLLISAMAELAKNLAFLAEAPLHFCASSKINNSYFVNYFTRFAVTKIRNKHEFFHLFRYVFYLSVDNTHVFEFI